MRSRHADLLSHDEEREITLAGRCDTEQLTSHIGTLMLKQEPSYHALGYTDDEQGPKHAFSGQRVSDRPNAVNTSLSSVTLTTGHGISTLLGLET